MMRVIVIIITMLIIRVIVVRLRVILRMIEQEWKLTLKEPPDLGFRALRVSGLKTPQGKPRS